MKDKINSIKSRISTPIAHIHRNRGRYAFAAGAATTVYIFNKMDRVDEWVAFLEEKGLIDEYTNYLIEA